MCEDKEVRGDLLVLSLISVEMLCFSALRVRLAVCLSQIYTICYIYTIYTIIYTIYTIYTIYIVYILLRYSSSISQLFRGFCHKKTLDFKRSLSCIRCACEFCLQVHDDVQWFTYVDSHLHLWNNVNLVVCSWIQSTMTLVNIFLSMFVSETSL